VRRIERAGVQPHSRRAEQPRLFGGAGEERLSESAADECGRQPEVRDLDGAIVMALELEEASALGVDETFPDVHVLALEMRGEPFVGPGVAIGPAPGRADGLVEAAIVSDVDSIAAGDTNGRIVEASRPERLGRAKLEVGANDVNRRQCDRVFSRWRAAFARFPQVAMSHHRRRPFFVLSKNMR
jgi:hypothetical protein